MRTAVEQLLVAGVVAVEGRVFQSHMADAKTAKPFLMVREGLTDTQQDWSPATTLLEVWPYVARGSYVTVDQLAATAIGVLDGARFADGTESYLAAYIGDVGEDAFDEQWAGLTRGIRFRVFNLGWLSGLTFDPDPVSALRAWITATWPEIQTDPSTWSPSNAAPAVYWRLVAIPSTVPTNWGAWLDAQLRAHVIAPSAAIRLTWVRRIAEGLALQGRVQLSDGSPLLFGASAADTEADPMRAGQVRLSARFGVLKAQTAGQPGGLLNHAVIGGDIEEVL